MTPAPISKYVSTTILNQILAHKTRKIVKLNCDFWKDGVVPKETIILFTDGERHVEVQVVAKSFFQSFGDAWFTHGDEIYPELEMQNITTIDQANKFFLSQGFKADDILYFGVVVVEFTKVS